MFKNYSLVKTGIMVSFLARAKQKIFPHNVHIQPPMQWLPAALSSAIKKPGHVADQSPPSSAEVKECDYTSTLPYTLTACIVTTSSLPFRKHL